MMTRNNFKKLCGTYCWVWLWFKRILEHARAVDTNGVVDAADVTSLSKLTVTSTVSRKCKSTISVLRVTVTINC